jgi:hypothetical protein
MLPASSLASFRGLSFVQNVRMEQKASEGSRAQLPRSRHQVKFHIRFSAAHPRTEISKQIGGTAEVFPMQHTRAIFSARDWSAQQAVLQMTKYIRGREGEGGGR